MKSKKRKKRGGKAGIYLAGSILVVTGLAIVMPKILDNLAEQLANSSASRDDPEQETALEGTTGRKRRTGFLNRMKLRIAPRKRSK